MSKTSVIFVLLSAAYFLVCFQRLSLGMLAPDIAAELRLGVAALGSLGSAFHYTYALFQIPGGYFIDRYGPRVPLALFFGLCGALGSLLFAASHDLAVAFGGRLLCGLGMSIVAASSCKIISAIFRQGLYMRMLSIYFAAGGLGMLFAAAPLEVLNSVWGWRQIFLVCGAVTAPLGGAFWFLLREGARQGAPAPMPAARTGDSFAGMLRRLFASPGFVPLLAWYVITPSIFFSFGSLWAAPFYETAWGLSRETVGVILSVGILGVIIGVPAGVWLAERLGSRPRVLRIAAALAVAGSLMLCLPAGGAALPLAVCSFTCVSLSGNMGASVLYALVRDHVPQDLVDLSTAVLSSSLFIMTALLQMLMGWLLGYFTSPEGVLPYAGVFLLYVGLGVASLLLALRLREGAR